MSSGSAERAADVAARALLEAGATALEAKLGAHVASFGANCWQTDIVIRSAIHRPDGKPYHRESIGRARRNMASRGLMHSSRVLTGERPTTVAGIKPLFRSAHGTTNKWINWAKLGIKNPVSRAEAREARRVNKPVTLGKVDPRPSYVSAAAVAAVTVDPGLAAVMQRAGASLERLWDAKDTRQDQAALDRVRLDLERRRGPPE